MKRLLFLLTCINIVPLHVYTTSETPPPPPTFGAGLGIISILDAIEQGYQSHREIDHLGATAPEDLAWNRIQSAGYYTRQLIHRFLTNALPTIIAIKLVKKNRAWAAILLPLIANAGYRLWTRSTLRLAQAERNAFAHYSKTMSNKEKTELRRLQTHFKKIAKAMAIINALQGVAIGAIFNKTTQHVGVRTIPLLNTLYNALSWYLRYKQVTYIRSILEKAKLKKENSVPQESAAMS